MKTNEEIIEELERIFLESARPSEFSSRKCGEFKFLIGEFLELKDAEMIEFYNEVITWKMDKLKRYQNKLTQLKNE